LEREEITIFFFEIIKFNIHVLSSSFYPKQVVFLVLMNKIWYSNHSIISYGMECFDTSGFVIDMAKTEPIEEVIKLPND